MTALEKYERLEAIGVWREGPDTPEREVVVSFGNATLVLTDLRENPLAHWALAGTEMLRQGSGGTVYSTSPEGFETLTIRDRDMVEAIAAVSRAHLHPGPAGTVPPRRRFGQARILFTLGALLMATWFGPELVRGQAHRMLPPDQAREFGDRMLLQVIAMSGAPCQERSGQQALSALGEAVAPGFGAGVRIIDLGVPAAVLPGGAVLIDRETLQAARAPEEVAGWIALARAREGIEPAAERLLHAAGLAASLTYVFQGDLSDAALAKGLRAALVPPAASETAAAFDVLHGAGIASAPFADALLRAGLPLPTAPPAPGGTQAVLSDQDWVAMQGICG